MRRYGPLRRLPLLLGTVLIAATLLAGCGGSQSGSQVKTLTLYNDKGAWTPFFNKVGALSKNETGVGLKPVGYTDASSFQAFIKASFRTNTKPDLFTWYTGGQLNAIVNEGEVADTSSVWQYGIQHGYLTKQLESYYTIGGKQYCVPLNVSYWVMFYNKHVFEQYGLSPPKTWSDLLQIAATLKSHNVTPFYETDTLFTFVWFEQLLAGANPRLYNQLSTGKASYTSAGVQSAMQQWKQLIDAGYLSNPGSKTDPGAQLKSGQIAMEPWGTWFNTSLVQLGLKDGSDYGMFVMPPVDGSVSPTPLIFESGPLCVEKSAPHLQASMDFLKWWISTSAQNTWAGSRDDVSGNPKVTIADQGLSALNSAAGSGHYQLVNRYYEATPPPILNTALDAFSAFMVNPTTAQQQTQQIQQSAASYWAGNTH